MMSQNSGTDDLPILDTDQTLQLPKERPCFAWLVVLRGPRRGRLFPLKTAGINIGRSSENDITIDDETVSRHHARIFADDGSVRANFFVQDLASANGTFVNGERVSRMTIQDEDRIAFGDTMFAFKQF
jgi:pSer/pThr/pTyr-binding forkhead associated (FHA) protein